MMNKRLVAFFIISALTLGRAHALKTGGHVKATLVSEVTTIQAGHPFWVAVRLEMQPGWHTYWKNAGESGSPTEITWSLPSGFKAGPIVWPTPQKIEVPPVVSYGYENEVLLLTQITPPNTFAVAPIKLAAHVDWLECEVVCIPGTADVSLSLPMNAKPSAINREWQERFDDTRFHSPINSADLDIHAEKTSSGFHLTIKPAPQASLAISDLYFFAQDPSVIDYSAPQPFMKAGAGYTLDLVKSESSTETVKVLRGVLVNSAGWRGPKSETGLSLMQPVTAPIAGSWSQIWIALLFSFIGGLILNLMPCVLPILSVKVLGFIQHAHANKASVFRHGLIFAAGVVLSFWILAGALLFLRAGGEQLGWGFQLQSPGFVGFLAALFFVLGLSMFGVFEIGTRFVQLADVTRGMKGYVGSFLSGVLATVVATPCTAPFMGSALGYALTVPPLQSLAVFTSLALGMASPYLFLTAHPAFLKHVPKPGKWINVMKKILGLFLFATVVWLLWILGTQLAIIKPRTAPEMAEHGLAWEPFSAERVEQLRKSGRIVFVDFSAAWCLTCQVNERVTLQSSDVVHMFKEKNVAMLKADWTSRDEKITRALQSFRRSGVPFYVLYPSNPHAAVVPLPEIITPKIVLDALKNVH